MPQIAQEMADLGCPLPPEEIGRRMIQYVTDEEKKQLPWIPGVRRLLEQLRDAGIPSMLVTTSPRDLAENLIAQAPKGTFAGYVCGDDDVAKKPDPAPYELATSLSSPSCHSGSESMSVPSISQNTPCNASSLADPFFRTLIRTSFRHCHLRVSSLPTIPAALGAVRVLYLPTRRSLHKRCRPGLQLAPAGICVPCTIDMSTGNRVPEHNGFRLRFQRPVARSAGQFPRRRLEPVPPMPCAPAEACG